MTALSVVGLGQISNVGRTVEGTCAALRAGVGRSAPVGDRAAFDPDELEAPVMGRGIGDPTDGFFHSGRWVVLGHHALLDLARAADLPLDRAEALEGTDLVWVLPALDPERFLVPSAGADAFFDVCCAGVLSPLARLALPRDRIGCVAEGGIGAARALVRARRRIEAGACTRAIVLATDSLLDPLSLLWLDDAGRLKTTEHPTGLQPGESGVALLVAGGSEPGASASIRGIAIGEPDTSPDPGAPPSWRTEAAPRMGRLLARTVAQALAEAGCPAPFRGDVVLDLNGETWRAMAWGNAQPLLTEVIAFAESRLVLPATSFGDIGAAAAAAGVCAVTQAFVRGHATGRDALVVSLAETGAASAMVVSAASPTG